MAKFKRVSLSQLTPGVVLRAPITDPHNPRIKLLAEGTEITQVFIDRLASRGVQTVVMSQRDIGILNAFRPQGRRSHVPRPHCYVRSAEANDHSEHLDSQIAAGHSMSVGEVDQPLLSAIKKPTDCQYADGLAAQWAGDNDRQIESVVEFFDDTLSGTSEGIGPLHQACSDIILRLSEDQDALVCLGCAPYESEYPPRHGIHLASVAMAIGVEMGLDRVLLIDLGIGCLLHDLGMKSVGLGMFKTKHSLSPAQLSLLADHPVKAIEIAGEYGDAVSPLSKIVAYQIHERCDGSGYPRGRTAEQIHQLAKIAAVADALVGMLSRRPHRLAIQGYYAIKQLLDEMKEGKFDARVIRALLQATSLFPLGSYVQLNNDCVGRVIRSGGGQFVRPTIEMWDKDHLHREPAVVNLKHEPSIKITRCMPAIRAA